MSEALLSSPLERLIGEIIEAQGAIDVGQYMTLALAHPLHGYYAQRPAIGASGDFVTAPEVSQVFGELVGAALAQCWLDGGSPMPPTLVELGPGNGTLMKDVLRTLRTLPEMLDGLSLHLVESSPALRARQASELARFRPAWHETLATLPQDRPLFVIANEFLDALPFRQFVRTGRGWCERLIGVEGGRLAWVLDGRPLPAHAIAAEDAPMGAIYETSPAREACTHELASLLARTGGTAYLIDYGHDAVPLGDTFQAVRAQTKVDPLRRPGEADLTSRVAFHQIIEALRTPAVSAYGPISQAAFLGRLGVALRLQTLERSARPERLGPLREGVRRLTAADGMGTLFQVVGLTTDGTPPAGFEAGERRT